MLTSSGLCLWQITVARRSFELHKGKKGPNAEQLAEKSLKFLFRPVTGKKLRKRALWRFGVQSTANSSWWMGTSPLSSKAPQEPERVFPWLEKPPGHSCSHAPKPKPFLGPCQHNSGAPPLVQILGMPHHCFPACLGLPAGSFAVHLPVQAGRLPPE